MIPKRLSFYWDQGETAAPDFVKRCWDSWAFVNPSWSIEVADSSVADRVFRNLEICHVPSTAQGRADIFRVADLRSNGGVYVDAATIPIEPLDQWLEPLAERGFFAYHDPYRRRSVENWFLAASPGNFIISRWLDEIVDYWNKPRRPQRRLRELNAGVGGTFAHWRAGILPDIPPRQGKTVIEPKNRLWSVSPDGGGKRAVYPYFWPHYIFELALNKDPELRQEFSRIPKRTSYKQLMLRHWKKRYSTMSSEDIRTLTEGSQMQKLALKILPASHQLDLVFNQIKPAAE